MGSMSSKISEDEEYYYEICRYLKIEEKPDMYEHMNELENRFGVRGKYDLYGKAFDYHMSSLAKNSLMDNLDKLEKKYERDR